MCERDIELMLLGALAADRKLPVQVEWFREELRQLAEDLKAKRKSATTSTWLGNRGVAVNGSLVESLLESVKSKHEACKSFSLASEVLRLKREIARLEGA